MEFAGGLGVLGRKAEDEPPERDRLIEVALDVEDGPPFDPTGLGEDRAAKLAAYRQARDQIEARIRARFGPPDAETGADAASG